MALIWAKGFTGATALAPQWRRYWLAQARTKDTSLSASELGTAFVEADTAKTAYDACVIQAEAALKQAADNGQAHTHALIVGVGRYQNGAIPALTTSVHGAQAFADWILTQFHHPDRPLGSVELLLSPKDDPGNWQPSPETATQLGLDSGGAETLPVEPATFAAIKSAFERWLKRAGARLDNAAFFYFAGHGLWKSGPLLLPEDAQLPTTTQSVANLIDIQQTQTNMFNQQPSVQCMFLDACQELSSALLNNLTSSPGEPLHQPTNAPLISERDASGYLGSFMGRKAYGPEKEAPFFTQELLTCLKQRSAASLLIDDTWSVTTNSLRTALEAASRRLTEEVLTNPTIPLNDKVNIQFSVMPGSSSFTAELCQIQGTPEVFVKLWCQPKEAMLQAKLYVEANGARRFRTATLSNEWYVVMPQGDYLAGVEFDPAALLVGTARNFRATPPLSLVPLQVKPQVAGGGA